MPMTSISPWDGSVVWQGPSTEDIAPVLARAASCQVPDDVHDRLRLLASVIIAHRQEAIGLLVREAGKVEDDAQAEVELLGRKIALSLDAGLLRTPSWLSAGAPPDARCVWRPRGLALCLGPFNFPLHLLHGLVVPALAVGCPVIAKPSERTPALGCWYRQCLAEAGLADIVQIVQGDAAVAQQCLRSPAIRTVAAVGSRRMGVALSQALAGRPEVVLALELGGVNHALLCPDADLDAALPVIADGAWRMAGQRCTSTRIVHVPQHLVGMVLERMQVLRQRWMPDGTPQASIGPLISVVERERFQRAFTASVPGFRHVAGEVAGHGAFAEPVLQEVTDTQAYGHDRYTQEHFGPSLIVDPYADEAQAVQRMQRNAYRLSAAIWTTDDDRFERLARQLPYGLVNRNRNTAGARSDMPFGGLGLSGNGRPAAVAAGQIFADEAVVCG